MVKIISVSESEWESTPTDSIVVICDSLKRTVLIVFHLGIKHHWSHCTGMFVKNNKNVK